MGTEKAEWNSGSKFSGASYQLVQSIAEKAYDSWLATSAHPCCSTLFQSFMMAAFLFLVRTPTG